MKVTKHALVAAATELFRTKGYSGMSMQDLADRIGLRKASLYTRFPNKESLVPDVMGAVLEEAFAGSQVEGRSWNEAYATTIRSIADGLLRNKRCVGLHLAYGIGDETPLAKQAVVNFFQAHLDRLTAILVDAVPRETAQELAADAMARLEGATLLVALLNDRQSMERAVRAVLKDAQDAATAHAHAFDSSKALKL